MTRPWIWVWLIVGIGMVAMALALRGGVDTPEEGRVAMIGEAAAREVGEAGGAGSSSNTATQFRRVRVEVLNGSGRPGLARQAMGRLRDAGFDVVYFGNAPAFDHEQTVVLERVEGYGEAARAVAETLGTGIVQSAPDATLHLEITVILGRDWPPQETAAEEESRLSPLRRIFSRLRE